MVWEWTPFNRKAVERVFEIKNRDKNKPLLLLVSSREQLETLVKEITPAHLALMQKFWPGSLTLLFESLSVFPRMCQQTESESGNPETP